MPGIGESFIPRVFIYYLDIMKKILFTLILIPVLFSCELEDEISLNGPLMNCSAVYLNYRDNHLFMDAGYTYPADNNGENRISFNYRNGQIVRVTGGFDKVPAGYGTLEELLFSDRVYDSIVHKGNTSYVYTRPERYYVMDDRPSEPIIYERNETGQLIRVIHRTGEELFYAKEGDVIAEMTGEQKVIRRFYMGGGNLIKVEKIRTRNGEPHFRKEMIFCEYDDAPNPLKDKYHILGAFYRAFSRNNYREMKVHKYYREEGEWVKSSSYTYRLHIQYNDRGQPLLGDYKSRLQ